MRRTYRVASVLGIPVMVSPTWFFLAALTTWILAVQIFPGWIEDQPRPVYILMALASAWFFFGSIILHELAHSVVAKLYRIPVRSITLFIFGGVAHITREASRPLAELLMAVAGPLMSALLGGVFFGVWWLAGSNTHRPIDAVIVWLAFTNVGLAIFNLIPAFPMDGGRVFRSLLWLLTGNYHRATLIAAWSGRIFGWALMAAGAVSLSGVDVYITEGYLGGAWLVLIGVFLENAARQGIFQNRVVRKLQAYQASELMLRNPPVVDAGMSLAALARGVMDLNPRVCYFVSEHGRLAGILSHFQIKSVHEALWDSTTAGQAMIPSAKLRAVGPAQPASDVLMEMETDELTHLPVVEGGQVLGVIGRDRILGVLLQAGYLRTA